MVASDVSRGVIAYLTLKALTKIGLIWYEPGHTETLYLLTKTLGKPSFPRFLNPPNYPCYIFLYVSRSLLFKCEYIT